MRRFAEDTSVPVARSRAQIDDLLRAWGCSGIAWIDDFDSGLVKLQFKWKREQQLYLAQFDLRLPDDGQLRKRARHDRTGAFLETKFRNLCDARGRQEHRVLLLWLKAALNAVEAGIIDPALIFLPFLVGRNGATFGAVALPRLPQLLIGNADRLLGTGE